MALGLIGSQENIESFSESRTGARAADTFYSIARQQLLSSHDWAFAHKTEPLSASAVEKFPDFYYAYDVPSDMLLARRVISPSGRSAKVPENQIVVLGGRKTVLTDIEQATLAYTYDCEDLSLFTPMAYAALAHLMGYYMAPAATSDKKRGNELLQIYTEMVSSAGASDANQSTGPEQQAPSWIANR
tara:strand:- start:10289 stop:10849 length:561 start_codon:yes stop_codon:yes gene_type:complete